MAISPRSKQALRWAPAVLFTLTVLICSTQKAPLMACSIDKLLHFLVYGILSVLIFWPLSRNGHRYPYLISMLAAIAIGVLDEMMQSCNPARVASLKDLLADGLGAWFGGTISRGVFRSRMKRDRATMMTMQGLLLFALFCGHAEAAAQELDIVNRPVNLTGLTGLFTTTTPFTMERGTFETAISAMSETSAVPDFTLNEFVASLTIGITRSMEIALRASYLTQELGLDPHKKRGPGDTELLYKWNFLPPDERPYIPAAAVFIAVQGLTGDRDSGFQRYHNWGAKAGISLGREINFEEHIIGVYFDGQLAVEDLNRNEYRDRYGLFNAGMLLPISKRHNLQLLIEYSSVSGKLYEDIDGKDSSTITYGIRLVSDRFNLTVGDQFIRKKIEGQDNLGKVIGTLSIKFK